MSVSEPERGAAPQEPPAPTSATPPAAKKKEPAVSFLHMFRYITPGETALNIFAGVAAVGNGIVFPVSSRMAQAHTL